MGLRLFENSLEQRRIIAYHFFCVSAAATPVATQGQGQAASGHLS